MEKATESLAAKQNAVSQIIPASWKSLPALFQCQSCCAMIHPAHRKAECWGPHLISVSQHETIRKWKATASLRNTFWEAAFYFFKMDLSVTLAYSHSPSLNFHIYLWMVRGIWLTLQPCKQLFVPFFRKQGMSCWQRRVCLGASPRSCFALTGNCTVHWQVGSSPLGWLTMSWRVMFGANNSLSHWQMKEVCYNVFHKGTNVDMRIRGPARCIHILSRVEILHASQEEKSPHSQH